MRRLLFLAPCLLASCAATPELVPGRVEGRTLSFGAELQVYPAGLIATAHARRELDERDSVFLRAGYNFTDRQDFGEHDDEEGGGPGFGVGWRRNLSPDADQGWLFGGRVDLFFLEIDWMDDPPATPASGTTDIVVLQPAVEGGYGWNLSGGRLELTATLGAEVNVDTDGSDVGEGAIGLLGVTYVVGR